MADHTPPPSPGAPGAGPRRILSVPDPVKGTSLLMASAASLDGDANWRRGVTILWVLFGLIGLAEMAG